VAAAAALAVFGAATPAALGAVPSAAAAQAGCPALPPGLSPVDEANRFTMMLRVNQMDNVEDYTNPNEATGGLGDRIRAQDIFVINSRYPDSTPLEGLEMVAALRRSFPCNRIITLNGLGFDPNSQGYFGALAGAGVHAMILDWEPDDWNLARFIDPSIPKWSYHFRPNRGRIRGWINSLSGFLASNPASAGTLAGLAPLDNPGWEPGVVARILDRANRRFGDHRAPQLIQAQEACFKGSDFFRHRARRVSRQYRFKFATRLRRRHGKLRKVEVRTKFNRRSRPDRANLALEISLSDTPVPGASLPILSTAPETADRCVAAGLSHGAGAFFFYASPDAMRLLFQQPTVGALRPETG
jgi:hypothetical protein